MKSGQYQQNNTYNKLIEPDNATMAATSMTNLLKLLSSKNIKQKLGKGQLLRREIIMEGVLVKPFPLLFLIQWIIQIRELVEPLKLLIQWKKMKLPK
ncbi:MgPa adhesin [Mycoplasmoides genitalium M6320]|uniref:MgPa adhesin n=1 Tax=Mycoplasmoides genitalium M6320 TaxID=662945 RepID=A0ABC7ZJA9_MYCGT|nr:MgPa adhesin [Mycoplasmoides genitalium M6320]